MFEIGVGFGFVAFHELDDVPERHPCAGMHAHTFGVEVVVAWPQLLPGDPSGQALGLEPLRVHLESLTNCNLNTVVDSPATPARLARHFFAWCLGNTDRWTGEALQSVRVSLRSAPTPDRDQALAVSLMDEYPSGVWARYSQPQNHRPAWTFCPPNACVGTHAG